MVDGWLDVDWSLIDFDSPAKGAAPAAPDAPAETPIPAAVQPRRRGRPPKRKD